jgi:hypothetical protein
MNAKKATLKVHQMISPEESVKLAEGLKKIERFDFVIDTQIEMVTVKL